MAVSLADEIKKTFGAEAILIEGGGGVFDVHVNGTQIWDKHRVGRFPEHQEMIDKIKAVTSAI